MQDGFSQGCQTPFKWCYAGGTLATLRSLEHLGTWVRTHTHKAELSVVLTIIICSAAANWLDAWVFLKKLQKHELCWQMGPVGILLRVAWGDSLDLSRPSHCHPDSLSKGKHGTDQREQELIHPFAGLAPKPLLPMAFVTLCSFLFHEVGITAPTCTLRSSGCRCWNAEILGWWREHKYPKEIRKSSFKNCCRQV